MPLFRAPLDPQITYPPVGRCIYCPDDGSNGLSDEHIIPYSLNGTQILPQASCSRCGGVTSYIDGFAARSVFYQVRSSAEMQTRSRLPEAFPVILTYPDGREKLRHHHQTPWADKQLDQMQLKLASSESPIPCPRTPHNCLWRFPFKLPALLGVVGYWLTDAEYHSV
jgi:hypothetical protein